MVCLSEMTSRTFHHHPHIPDARVSLILKGCGVASEDIELNDMDVVVRRVSHLKAVAITNALNRDYTVEQKEPSTLYIYNGAVISWLSRLTTTC